MEANNNRFCDLETGVCGPESKDGAHTMEFIDLTAPKETAETTSSDQLAATKPKKNEALEE